MFAWVAEGGGCVSARRPTCFLLLRQKKVGKEKATPLAVSLRFAAGNLRCSRERRCRRTRCALAALRSDNCGKSDHEAWASFGAPARLTRCASRHVQRGGKSNSGHRCARPGCRDVRSTSGRVAAAEAASRTLKSKTTPGFGQARLISAIGRYPWHPKPRAERSDGPCGAPLPSGCAWVGVLAGWRLHRRMQPLRDLTGRSCPNEAAQQRSEFCGPPRQRPDPGCPAAKRRGRSQQGRLSFESFSLAKQRKGLRPPGRDPASAFSQAHPASKKIAASASSTCATTPKRPQSNVIFKSLISLCHRAFSDFSSAA